MISPQSQSLQYCYDPYIAKDQVLFLDANTVGYLHPSVPETINDEWIWVMAFDHKHICVYVAVRGFQTLENAYSALMWLMWASDKVFHVGGVTMLLSPIEYTSIKRERL